MLPARSSTWIDAMPAAVADSTSQCSIRVAIPRRRLAASTASKTRCARSSPKRMTANPTTLPGSRAASAVAAGSAISADIRGVRYVQPKPVSMRSRDIHATARRQVAAATIRADATIAQANRAMITRGVRLLLVVDVTGTVMGLITARDIVGEKPVNLLHETHGKHRELTVADLMVPQNAIDVLDIEVIRHVEVGHVIATLKDVGRQHALVVDRDPLTHEEFVR